MLKLCRSILLSLLAGGIIFLNHALAMQRDPTTMYGGEWPDSYYSESDALKDWSVYNYTSDAWLARKCVVRWGGKTYDPLSFKGNENDTYGMSLLDCL
jgi:hypothetical protein